jgi:signal peptidase I
MKKMKTIGKIAYYLFISCVLVVSVLLLISAFPITGNLKFLTVLSGSMEPAIRTGSVVMVKPAAEYRAGDVITFGPATRQKPPTTHRIIEVKEGEGGPSFVTQGDANNAPDSREVRPREVIGKVRLSAPYLGYAVTAAQKPYGFLLIIVLPALLIISDEVRKILEEFKKRRNKQIT